MNLLSCSSIKQGAFGSVCLNAPQIARYEAWIQQPVQFKMLTESCRYDRNKIGFVDLEIRKLIISVRVGSCGNLSVSLDIFWGQHTVN